VRLGERARADAATPAWMRRFVAVAAGAALAGAPDAWAAEPPETVRVEGEAPRAPEDAAASCTVIRPEDYAGRITSLADLLAQVAGVHLRALGGLDSYATVSIRGSTAEQVNVYVDGVLLNSALGGGVDLSSLSLAQIESIEVYRGVVPAWLEGSGIGGAVSIRTRGAGGAHPSAGGSLSYGSHATTLADAHLSWGGVGPRGARDGTFVFSGHGTEGDFRFFDTNGTPFDGSDDGWSTRVNNASWLADAMGRMGIGLASGGRLEMQAGTTRRRQGVPGIDALQSETARSEMGRVLARVGWTDATLLDGALHADAGLFYSRTRQTFRDRAGDITGGLSTDAHDTLAAVGPSLVLRWRAPSGDALRHHLTWQSSGRMETASQVDEVLPQSDRGELQRISWNAALEDEMHMAGGRLTLLPSVRWTSASSRRESPEGSPEPGTRRTSETRWTGRLGAAWRPRPAWVLRANAGRFHRLPGFLEMFGDQGAIRPAGDLRAEEGWNTDAGVAWEKTGAGTLRRLALAGTVFQTLADDLIQLVQTSQSQVTARNTGRARITGTEWEASAEMRGGLGGSVNYTRQAAEDRSDRFTRGSDLPGRPRHELSARAQIDRSWGHPSWEMTWIGPYFVDAAAAAVGGSAAGADRIPGRYLHSVAFTAPAGPRLDWTIEVDNVGNVRTVDLVRYPLPGRVVQARLRLALK